jgi:hypothetical protein
MTRQPIGMMSETFTCGASQHNNLALNVIKTNEIIVDYRKKRTEQSCNGGG